MTTIEIVAVAGSPWRGAYQAPKNLDLTGGPWCPMDIRTGLLAEQHGWVCASCGAWWGLLGGNGRWLPARGVRVVDGHLDVAARRRWWGGLR